MRQPLLYRSTKAPTARLTSSTLRKTRPWIACSLIVRLKRSATPFVRGCSTKA